MAVAEYGRGKGVARPGNEGKSVGVHKEHVVTSSLYVWMLLLGFSVLLPWKTVVAAADYYNSYFTHTNIYFYCAVVYNFPLLAGLFVMVVHGQKYWHPVQRVFAAMTVMLASIISLLWWDGLLRSQTISTDAAFFLVLLSVFVNGCATSVMYGSVYGIAALFGTVCTQALQAGMGWAGVVTISIRMATKVSMPLGQSAVLFFTLTCVTLLLAFWSFRKIVPVAREWGVLETLFKHMVYPPRNMLVSHDDAVANVAEIGTHAGWTMTSDANATSVGGNPGSVGSAQGTTVPADNGVANATVDREHNWEEVEHGQALADPSEESPLIPSTTSTGSGSDSGSDSGNRYNPGEGANETQLDRSASGKDRGTTSSAVSSTATRALTETPHRADNPWDRASPGAVLQKIRYAVISVQLVFVVTLSITPGVLTSLESVHGLGTWFPVLMVFSFDIGDLAGKSLPVIYRPIDERNPHQLLYLVALHSLFVPVFVYTLTDASAHTIFQHESVLMTLALLLGMSNGFIACSALMIAPKLVTRPEKELAGIISTFFLTSGLSVGSLCGLAIGTWFHL